ncbi:hypothetical protein B0H14DRAFT_2980042 [Mycena olivaceomarginata]|nr:hypothetical protein B0H14DRAFT_2980042 [Mycena olivaceomarginata]
MCVERACTCDEGDETPGWEGMRPGVGCGVDASVSVPVVTVESGAGDSVSGGVAAAPGWDGTRPEVGSGRAGGEGTREGEATPGWEGISPDVERGVEVDAGDDTDTEVGATPDSEDACPVCTVLRLVLGAAEVAESSRSLGGIAECTFVGAEDAA